MGHGRGPGRPPQALSGPRLGLVLGAGGVVGLNYHAGVLHALAEVGGVDPGSADLVVGTSAGSVSGALIRSGWTARDCWELALGTHPLVVGLSEAEQERRRRSVMTPAARSPLDLARRAVGSAYVVGRSVARGRPGLGALTAPRLPTPIARSLMHGLATLFPGGMVDVADNEASLAEVIPDEWPERRLWLVAVDIGSGRRVVLGRPGATPREVGLRRAVMASCAIPGVYPPVRAGGRILVDGGAHSTTNLDLAARDGCEVIVGVAPMAFDPATRPAPATLVQRRMASGALMAEMREARHRGAVVLLVRPGRSELALHGNRLMRPDDTAAIARAAYEATARLLDSDRARNALDALAA